MVFPSQDCASLDVVGFLLARDCENRPHCCRVAMCSQLGHASVRLLLREPRLPQASWVTTGHRPALLLLTARGRHKLTQSELVLQFYVTVKALLASRKDEVFILPLTPQTA